MKQQNKPQQPSNQPNPAKQQDWQQNKPNPGQQKQHKPGSNKPIQ